MNIHRILIANRGEIAVRIIRTCRELGIETVLAASSADTESMAARLADQVVVLGPAPAAASYLNIAAVINAALQVKADAIHPGYGFLSENSRLAIACNNAGLIFIGPTPSQLLAIGDKLLARGNAVAAGLPVVPGGEVNTRAEAEALVKNLGLPVLIKAVGGGGGRGMKLVTDSAALHEALQLATAEAQAAFGDPRLYIERYVQSGRHVEVQLLGDGSNIIHLGTRDCSVQRRYQKLIEEAPAPNLSDALRTAIHDAAVMFGKHLHYVGAGTVEFLVDVERDSFYFLEMNARIQVEHPVTEAICHQDLIAAQIRIAEGKRLNLRQQDIQFDGHAIECRLNAEDCAADFRPVPGTITTALFPAGVGIRMDTHMQQGAVMPPYYDSLLGKLIVHGKDRAQALQRLQTALQSCHIEGVPTNLVLHQSVCAAPAFQHGGVDTGFLPTHLAAHPLSTNTLDKKTEATDGHA
ncbi:MAG: acetyl-CoA carboxylase biotin carboxylase subunit [Pseudomonadota bacterium]